MNYDDCKFRLVSCDLCGITGNQSCPNKCKDYEPMIDFDDGSDDWD